MITALSVLFWFISQHPLLTFFAAMVLAGLVSWWRRFPGYAIVVFPLAMLNMFLGHFLNATFLNVVGERGSARLPIRCKTSCPTWPGTIIFSRRSGASWRSTA